MKKIIPFPEDPLIKKHSIWIRDLDLPQRDIDLLNNIGIHVGHLEDLDAGRLFGADITDLADKKGPGIVKFRGLIISGFRTWRFSAYFP